MIAKLNLASHPFRNRTLPWAVTLVVSAASLVALVFVVGAARQTKAQADQVERDVVELRRQRAALQTRVAEIRQEMQPEQLRTLEAAQTLVERRHFSWSKLLSDLEAALPGNVRVSRINVRDVSRVGAQTRADLDMVVVGRQPDDVTGMIMEMNRGGTFSVVPVAENPRTNRGETGIEWTLRVTYVQRALPRARASEGEQRAAANVTDAGSPAAAPARTSGRGAR